MMDAIPLIRDEHESLLRRIPYLGLFYQWEQAMRPLEEPTLRPAAMFGDGAEADLGWALFVELLFPVADPVPAEPLFGYRFRAGIGWQFGLLLEYRDSIYALLDFLGVEKSHRKSVMTSLTSTHFERCQCPEPPPVSFLRGLPKYDRPHKKRNGVSPSNKYAYPTLGTTADEDALVPPAFQHLLQKERRHKRRRRYTY